MTHLLTIYVFYGSLLLTNLVEASRRGARLRSHGCVMGDRPLMQLLHKHGLTLQERHFSAALKNGDETTPDGNENTPVGVEPPQDAGGWTGHPCSASPTAWGWLALMVYVRDGYGTTHGLPQILLFFWPHV